MSEKRRTHCWEDGPETPDGCSTTCMLWSGHKGPHKWTRDDQIGVSFAPAEPTPMTFLPAGDQEDKEGGTALAMGSRQHRRTKDETE